MRRLRHSTASTTLFRSGYSLSLFRTPKPASSKLLRIVGSLRALGTLEVGFTEIHPGSFDASFFCECVAKGTTVVGFTFDRPYFEAGDTQQAHTTFMDVTSFCFAEAVSGIHRRIGGRYANGRELIQAIIQRAEELRDPASKLRFTITDVPDLTIGNLGCGLPVEIVVATKPDRLLRDVTVRIG